MSGAQASCLKTLATELHQKIASVGVDIAGPAAGSHIAGNSAWLQEGVFATRKYLASRAASIYSGTNETHRNQIANAIGLVS
jgi:alkylation response protein AidB-like acyl-CoA dehydrogenase